MKKLDTLLQLMKGKAFDHKAELERNGGGDGPDWLWIDGYYQAIADMEKSINCLKAISQTKEDIAEANKESEDSNV